MRDGGSLGEEGLHHEPEFVDLRQLRRRRFPQEDSLLSPLHHEPLGLKLQDRVANRAAAEAELRGQIAV